MRSFSILFWVLCALSDVVLSRPHHIRKVKKFEDFFGVSALVNFARQEEHFAPMASITQGMNVTETVALYEVCKVSESTTSPCSPVLETLTTASCSTLLTAWFTVINITDCKQSITFSTRSSFLLSSTAITATTTPAPSIPPTTTISTFVQTVVSYYVAPWQSLVEHNTTGITVRVCSTDVNKTGNCKEIQEVWVVRTEVVPVYSTKTISIVTSIKLVSSCLESSLKGRFNRGSPL